MKIRLTIFAFITWTSVLGQTSIVGDWKALSIGLIKELKEETKIQDRYYKVVFNFNEEGSYSKSFYVPKRTIETPLYNHYEVKNGKLVKKQILNEDGYALKMLSVKEKTEAGQFKVSSASDTIVFTINSGQTYKLGLKLESSNLLLIDTVDSRAVYLTFVTDKRKVKKRGRS